MQKTVLIVDDEPAILSVLSSVLKDEGYAVTVAKSGEEAISFIQRSLPDLIFLDVWMSGIDGIETLKRIRALGESPVIVMSGHGSIETAVRAIKCGAYDFIEKPFSLEKVILTAQHALTEQRLTEENQRLRRQVEKKQEMIGESTLMQRLRAQIKQAAPTQSRILISGENGTGKELVARAIHAQSGRWANPFVDINCAAIPEQLIESELFGYEKGAFTGADRQKRGQFERADGGTLFLDEIGDMALATQAKLLRVLQEQSFCRVGGTVPIEVDVRVIAASNKNLKDQIANGTFREDLYYRLNVIPLALPPLRDRVEDIPVLAIHFIKEIAEEQGIKPKELTPAALDILRQYRWPGNVREMQNLLERLMILIPDSVIRSEDILACTGTIPVPVASDDGVSLKTARNQFERAFILKQLEKYHVNVKEAAEALGIGRTHLHQKIKLLEIEPHKGAAE